MSEFRHAVWDGRFQPPHRGHVAVIERALRQFECDLTIMVIQSSEGWKDEYGEEANRHHKLSRNPLTYWERMRLIELSAPSIPSGLTLRIQGIPRPDLHWDFARPFYPPDRFIVLTGKDEYEQRKVHFWTRQGETTRLLEATDLPTFSASDLKTALHRGLEWERFMPEGAIGFFKAVDGPARFKAADI